MGAVKKIRGTLKRAIQVYETELKIYNNTNSVADRPPPHIDIFELFSGTSKFTTRSIKHQLNALAPMDIEHGPHQDFKDEAVRKEVFRLLKKFKPWLTALGIDCRLWSIFSENLNFSQDPQLLQQLRELELPLVLFAAEVAMHQMDHHRFFLIENPVRSRLWTLPVMIQLLQQPGVWSTVLDTGAWGAEIDGQMIIKPMRFVGNLPGLDEVIHKRLSEHERQWCQPIQGTMTKKSQEYPDALVDAILKHLRKAIQQMEPFRFNINLVYAVAQPAQDLDAWRDIFNDIEEHFQRGSNRPYNVETTSTTGQAMSSLIRMDAIRIQVAHTPTTRRLPTNVLLEMTHRATILKYTDGSIKIELDHLPDLQFPKQRFEKPVQFGIFMYGTMREVQQPTTSTDPLIPIRDLPTDITFPGLPQQQQIPQEVRKLVARLHLNLGHPSKQELSRMIAYHGGAPPAVNICIQHLKCATCDRLKPPQQPRPAALAKMHVGQFGDELAPLTARMCQSSAYLTEPVDFTKQ